jgi:hypothetical protein
MLHLIKKVMLHRLKIITLRGTAFSPTSLLCYLGPTPTSTVVLIPLPIQLSYWDTYFR